MLRIVAYIFDSHGYFFYSLEEEWRVWDTITKVFEKWPFNY